VIAAAFQPFIDKVVNPVARSAHSSAPDGG